MSIIAELLYYLVASRLLGGDFVPFFFMAHLKFACVVREVVSVPF